MSDMMHSKPTIIRYLVRSLGRLVSGVIMEPSGHRLTSPGRHRKGGALPKAQLGRIGLLLSFFISAALLGVFSSVPAMVELTENEMSEVAGQALMQMTKTAGDAGTVSQNMIFYKAGLNAELELNMNIEKLQLGCTAHAINGQHCDIDIDHLSLSGRDWVNGRPESSALLTRPFIEFAIENDGTPLREVVGFRLSAENALGLLTAGQNGPQPNGINSLSGYMTTTNISGNATTAATNLGCGRANAAQCAGDIRDPFNTVLSFDTNPDILLCTSGCYSGNTGTSDPSQSAGVYIPELPVNFNAGGAVINGRRQTSTSVTAFAPVPTVNLAGGQLHVNMQDTISVAYFISVSEAVVNLGGTVSGLETQINFTQDLGLIHRFEVDSPFSLSFQRDPVKWPGTAPADIAQQGWWMSFADAVDLGELNPVEEIDITPAFAQMAQAFNNHFAQGCTQPCAGPIPIATEQGLEQLFNGQMTVNVGPQTITTNPLLMDVSNLQLGASQNVVPNCWGNATFC